MASNTEHTLADTVIEQRTIIARDIDQVRDWLKVQTVKDIKDDRLSTAQRAMARRIFNRALHIGTDSEQATNQELDTYFIEAKILREVVPVQVASVQQGIEDAARTVCTIFIYADLVEEAKGSPPGYQANSDEPSRTHLVAM